MKDLIFRERVIVMRMWMCDPKILCQKHLCGEHVELHMFIGHLNLKRNINGFIENNLLEPLSIISRHDELMKEMLERGYKHKSPIKEFDLSYLSEEYINHKIDKVSALKELISRCPECGEKLLNLAKIERI